MAAPPNLLAPLLFPAGHLLTTSSFVPPHTAIVDAYQRKLADPDCPVSA